VKSLSDLRVQIFADGADRDSFLELYRQPYIKGFTTNPTLMRAMGVTDYQGFALDLLASIQDRPISFEVFADDEEEMEDQARQISGWAKNVFVKIPVMNTEGKPTYELVRRLSRDGIQLNVTALLTLDQVRQVSKALKGDAPAYVSVFAGRIADTGRDPMPIMKEAAAMVHDVNAQLIWASPRELLNVFQADEVGCHVITATVQMFRNDALKSGYSLPIAKPATAASRR
jgi:transaldolase